MDFASYMKSLSPEKMSERTRMVYKIADACKKSPITVYNWMAGRNTPEALERQIISEVTGIPEHVLFPDAGSGR